MTDKSRSRFLRLQLVGGKYVGVDFYFLSDLYEKTSGSNAKLSEFSCLQNYECNYLHCFRSEDNNITN